MATDRNLSSRDISLWVRTVLVDRGVRVGDVAGIRAVVANTGPDGMAQLVADVTELSRGGGTTATMDRLADWARATFEVAEPPPVARAAGVRRGKGTAERSEAASKTSRLPPTDRVGWPHHVYGAKAALCVEVIEIERADDRDDFSTLQLEFAAAAGARHYAWDNKQIFRLGRRELPVFAGALFGFCGTVNFEAHGQRHDKSLSLEDQGGHLFVKFRKGRLTLAVQLAGGDIMDVSVRAMRAMMLNAPGIDSQTITLMCRRAAQLHATASELGSPHVE